MRALRFADLADLNEPTTTCAVCGTQATTGDLAVGCERCGTLTHGECYLAVVASTAERVTLDLTAEPYTFICRGCRS